jgi:hypothetical protein
MIVFFLNFGQSIPILKFLKYKPYFIKTEGVHQSNSIELINMREKGALIQGITNYYFC